MVKLSQTEVLDLRQKAESASARARSALAKADEAVDKVVTATVTGGAAFAFGVAQGRYGSIEVVGVPADLGAGVALHALGFIGVGGRNAEYTHAAGNGALACYLATLGRGVGTEWRQRALAGGGGTTSALPPAAATSGATISDAELARMARGGV